MPARAHRPSRLRALAARFSYVLPLLAVAGAVVCLGRLFQLWQVGGWPPHDSAAYWVAGAHLRQGAPVYESLAGDYLAFLYAPPWAVIFAVLMLLPLAAALLVGQVLGLRYVMGSWIGVGLMGWLPIVADELSIGNVDFIMAAVILAGASQKRWSGPAIALFAFAKLSPVLVLSRSTLRGAALGAALLVALTLPWWHLWPEWIGMLSQSRDSSLLAVPLLPRIPIAFGLLAIRRPWAVAAAAAMATPALYFHSVLLFLPAIRLMVANRASARAIFLRRFGHSSDFVQTTPDAALP